MFAFRSRILVLLLASPLAVSASAAEPLKEKTWRKGEQGAVIVQMNWGRQWPCGGFENAQLVRLEFTEQSPKAGRKPDRMTLETPSVLRVDDRFDPVVALLRPGTYALSEAELKIAKSVSDVRRAKLTTEDMTRDGRPGGGMFRVEAGEIVYIGGFGLDCAQAPIPWRYYIDNDAQFRNSVAAFRKHFPFTRDTAVRYRLFESALFAQPPVFPEGASQPADVAAETSPPHTTANADG